MEERREKELAKKLDNYIFITLKITAILALLSWVICYMTASKFVWTLIIVLLGFTASLIFVLIKGGITGKRYAQGAKTRRNKFLPIYKSPYNTGLEDDVIPYLFSKKP